TGAGARACVAADWLAGGQYRGRSGIRLYLGSYPLDGCGKLALAADTGGASRYRPRFEYLLCIAKPARGSCISDDRREAINSGRIGTRRAGKVETAPILCARSLGEWPRMAFGLHLYRHDGGPVRHELLDASADQSAVEWILQQLGRTPHHDSKSGGPGSHDS